MFTHCNSVESSAVHWWQAVSGWHFRVWDAGNRTVINRTSTFQQQKSWFSSHRNLANFYQSFKCTPTFDCWSKRRALSVSDYGITKRREHHIANASSLFAASGSLRYRLWSESWLVFMHTENAWSMTSRKTLFDLFIKHSGPSCMRSVSSKRQPFWSSDDISRHDYQVNTWVGRHPQLFGSGFARHWPTMVAVGEMPYCSAPCMKLMLFFDLNHWLRKHCELAKP